MSLYDDIETPEKRVKSDDSRPGGSSWTQSGLKLLQSQIALKKASLTARDRERGKTGNTSSEGAKSSGATVVDLRASSGSSIAPSSLARSSLLQPRKALADGPPLSFIPTAAKDEQVLIFGETVIENEYDPMCPNDFNILAKQAEVRAIAEREARAEERREERSRKEAEKEEREESRKRSAGAAIAPPTALAQSETGPPPAMPNLEALASQPASGKGMTAAARMMEMMGYKKGTGLGREKQGMTMALQVEKTSERGGRIIHERDMKEEPKFEDMPTMPPTMPPPNPPTPAASVLPPGSQPPAPEPTPITELLKAPTKLILLKNMVGPGEVDPDLEGEIREEMGKYGGCSKVLCYEMPPPSPDYEAVRIFIEFAKVDQAIKAVVDLNGRFFGGRQIRAAFYDLDKFAAFDLAS